MPDDFTPHAPSPDPNFSAEQLSTARTDWVARGLDPATFDAAFAPKPAAPPAAGQDQSAPTGRHGGFSTAQAREMVTELRQHSPDIPDERLSAALLSEGFSAEQAAAILTQTTDTRNDDTKRLDAGGLAPASPGDYGQIAYPPEFTRSLDAAGFVGFDQQAKAALAEMGIPALQGPSLVQDIVTANLEYRGLSEPDRAAYSAREDQRLVNALGSHAAAKAAVGRAMATLNKCPLPFLEALNGSGALRSASVILALSNAATLAEVRAAVAGGAPLAKFGRH